MANTKIPSELSSTPSISDSGDATAITIDSSEQVGINNTTPNSFSAGARNLVVGSGSGDEGITINSGTDSTSRIHFADGTSGGALYDGFLVYNHNSQLMSLGTGATGTQSFNINASGNIGIGTTNIDTTLANNVSLEMGVQSVIHANTSTSATGILSMACNGYLSSASGGSWKYKESGKATLQQYDDTGDITFYSTPTSANADDALTWKELFRMRRSGDANSSPYFFFGTQGTGSGTSAPAFFAALTSPSAGTNYYFQFLEATDNSSAASIKCGGLLASASYAAANPDRGDIYAQDNVSAASFTDRTPYPTSLQLAQDVINSHQRRTEEEITRLATEQYNKIHSEESDMPQPEKESLSLEEYLTKYKKEYELDHDVLHDYVNDTKYAENGIEGRDASATISCLVEVVKDLMQRIETLENS